MHIAYKDHTKSFGESESGEERAQRLLAQLEQCAIEAVERPREERECFIAEVAERYCEDGVKNGLSASQASASWDSVREWLRQLAEVTETGAGATGGHG